MESLETVGILDLKLPRTNDILTTWCTNLGPQCETEYNSWQKLTVNINKSPMGSALGNCKKKKKKETKCTDYFEL